VAASGKKPSAVPALSGLAGISRANSEPLASHPDRLSKSLPFEKKPEEESRTLRRANTTRLRYEGKKRRREGDKRRKEGAGRVEGERRKSEA
jgi:hypothetical protein